MIRETLLVFGYLALRYSPRFLRLYGLYFMVAFLIGGIVALLQHKKDYVLYTRAYRARVFLLEKGRGLADSVAKINKLSTGKGSLYPAIMQLDFKGKRSKKERHRAKKFIKLERKVNERARNKRIDRKVRSRKKRVNSKAKRRRR
jgi:hypothetical protein